MRLLLLLFNLIEVLYLCSVSCFPFNWGLCEETATGTSFKMNFLTHYYLHFSFLLLLHIFLQASMLSKTTQKSIENALLNFSCVAFDQNQIWSIVPFFAISHLFNSKKKSNTHTINHNSPKRRSVNGKSRKKVPFVMVC